ncbi:ATP-binding protein [Undibacterium sp. TJN19]|uniref:ATP-binding protein n=1 Tax=Undibacterium sp. TJN19 TaxID=3413055 RepID=UPI003BF27E4A
MVHSEAGNFIRVGGLALQNKPAHCAQHGDYTAYSHRAGCWSACEHCLHQSDLQQQQAQRQKDAAAIQAARWQQRLGRAAIPARFCDRSLQNYVASCAASELALHTCIQYAAQFDEVEKQGLSLIFCGGVGTGKTHLAIGIARQVLASGRQAVFTSVLKALRHIKATYQRDSQKTEDQAIQELVEPALLILDEVGVQFGSETEKMLLFEIINGRYEVRKPSILISNLGLADLEKYIGSRVMDRLREGGGKAVVFDWASYRRIA